MGRRGVVTKWRATAAWLCLALVATSAPMHGEGDEDDMPAGEREALLALIRPRAGEHIADLGCGSGTWTVPLARAVGNEGRVYAVDIDPRALALTRERLVREEVENVEVLQSLPDDPLLPAQKLDGVFLNDVIDYVERRSLAGFLAGIRNALKPTGRLVVRDPNGGADRIVAECYRAGFTLVEAKIPLREAAQGTFSDSWYALKLRLADRPQASILPRLGQPERRRTRLLVAEEMYRLGMIEREHLRRIWERVQSLPGAADPAADERRDLLDAAAALDLLEPAQLDRLRREAASPPR